jgi:hypothetical protein
MHAWDAQAAAAGGGAQFGCLLNENTGLKTLCGECNNDMSLEQVEFVRNSNQGLIITSIFRCFIRDIPIYKKNSRLLE